MTALSATNAWAVGSIRGATLTQLIGGDHYIMEERPCEVTAALLELLARPSVVSRGLKPSDLD